MSFSDDIAAKLHTASLGTVGTDIFVNSTAVLPGGKGPYAHIRDTGGPDNVRRHSRVTQPYRRPSCQVMVYATDAATCKARAWAMFAALTGIRNATVNGAFYLEIEPVGSEPADMGKDGVGRQRFSFNVGSMRQF